MTTEQLFQLLEKYPFIKNIKIVPASEKVLEVETFPRGTPVQAVTTMPIINDMPPDDVMLFAATEDPEEAMKIRNSRSE